MRISDWSSDVCSSDLVDEHQVTALVHRNPTPVDPAQLARPGQGRTIDAQRGHRSFESCLLEADAAHCLIDGREATHRLFARPGSAEGGDRKSVVSGKGVSGSVDTGGRRIIQTKNIK